MDNVTDFVNVAVRIKPTFSNDTTECNLKVVSNNPPILCVSEKQNFTFDHIFEGDEDQDAVFSDIIRPMIDKFLLGYNCTVFAYGQTGTGKTYTMGNPQNVDTENMGMINRTFKELFENLNSEIEIDTEVSLYEIYNEKVFDLLDGDKVPLQIQRFAVPQLKKVRVHNLPDAQELFLIANKNRRTAGTLQNANSSRSHAIYTLFCTIKNGGSVVTSKFNFVDLAGSESVRKTGSEGNLFHEGVNIKKGLLCLGQVINALSSNQRYIPYRQSVITSILKDSLSKKNYITLIACISAKVTDTTETLQTLDFARRVKGIINKPEVYMTVNNSARKDGSDYFTPLKPVGCPQTSTVLRKRSAMIPISEDRKHELPYFDISEYVSISPIVRKCVEVVESQLPTTVSKLVNEETRKRRSRRIQDLCQKCNAGPVIDENSDSVVFKKQRKSDQNILRDITIDNTVPMEEEIDPKKKENQQLSAKETTPIIPLFKVPSTLNIQRSRRNHLKQTTSSPNVTTDYNKFVTKLTQQQSLDSSNQDQTLSIMSASVLRRSVRLQSRPPAKSMYEFGDTSHLPNNSKRTNTTKRHMKDNVELKVHAKKLKNPKMKQHCNRILEILNTGTLNNLTTLQTIGIKSAEKIVLYRHLRGKFRTILDVQQVLTRGQSYNRFLEANMLV